MRVWSIAPVEACPEVTLARWQVFDVQLPEFGGMWSRHFVGYSEEDRQGQVSSPVETFSPPERAGLTRSGRTYLLSGHPGMGLDADYVWNRWKRIWKVPPEGIRDVTAEVWTLISTGAAR